MGKEIQMTPLKEEELEDQRPLVAQNCFIEIDIAMKAYEISIGPDNAHEELQLLHSSFAYILSNHEIEHKLSNVNIEEFEIPNSSFKTKEDTPTNKIYSLTPRDAHYFITNLIINAKSGFIELAKSGYFEQLTDDLFMEKSGLVYQIGSMLDRCILLMNNKYSNSILNTK